MGQKVEILTDTELQSLGGSKEAKNIATDISKFRKTKDNLIQNKFIRFICTVMATRIPRQETKSFTKINWILGSEKESYEFQSMSSQFNVLYSYHLLT